VSTNETPQYVAWVKGAVRTYGSVDAAWAAYREAMEYFDGEVEIEAAYKAHFYAAARSK